ncbi:hybrid sensor histidine kinase/response regulator [Aliiruegeria lutimaris]|uniref:Sensory/regulatory protein RpfC n=1 Tax=Aliiruegeria lutimaris TaxID=571298 RepID=A0A1G9GKJ8_9RHOB|nr:PAS domain-containing hybrid sensor histidine kinase/response regulator [Aliiruegeria lutimaris]SDL01199.1 PAS/PAC sensor hybrid histidine kinase [Aliiruegeria lutimaris]
MDPRMKEADEALEQFRASRTAEGRFLSYCRGRSRSFRTRQAIVFVLFPVMYHLGGLQMAILAATVSVSGEAFDCYVLSRYAKRSALGDRLPPAIGLTTLTGGLQAGANAFAITLMFSLGHGDTRVLAGAACFAGILDAALVFSAHRGASIIRIIAYFISASVITYQEWLRNGISDPSLIYEALSICFLIYVCWLIVRHVFKTQERSNKSRMRTLENARELAHTNAALEQSRQTTRRLALVAEHASDCVIVTDQNGIITWVNRAFSRITGYSYAEAVGRNVTFLNGAQTDAASAERLNKARDEMRPIRIEIINHHKDGNPIWVDVNMSPLFDEQGDLLSFVSIERDIGEAKEREQALAEARRVAEDSVRARRNFLATMSHEIRTPMNGVIGTTELLLETDLDRQQETLVRTISSSGDSLLAIINEILDFSRLEEGRLEVIVDPFDPDRCFESAIDLVQPLADAKGLRLRMVLPSSLPQRLIGDERRLSQVLLNLLGNAIKFTEIGNVELEVSVRLVDGTCDLLVLVRDTGVGIEASQLERVFESFVQADSKIAGRFGGTGLGLAISRLLVRAMGGEISVSSAPGSGTVFFVSLTLPIAEQDTESRSVSERISELPPVTEDLSGVRILVAEDNRTNTMLLERMLAGTGASLLLTENGREALELFRQHAPDIVLMDLHMPILDGLAATGLMRQAEKDSGATPVPIIALTANAFPEDRDLCIASGMDGIITKPFRKRDLLNAITSALAVEQDPLQSHRDSLTA